MTKSRIGGLRRKSRHKMRKNVKAHGKLSLTRFLQTFTIGQRAQLVAEPAYHKGLYHMRFHGKMGTIKEQRGQCYIVTIQDKNKAKDLVVHPVHLKRI